MKHVEVPLVRIGRWEIEEDLFAKRWEFDCIDINLTQNDSPDPVRYSGKGHLRQVEDGAVTFRIYPPETPLQSLPLEHGSFGEAGTLVPDNAYYTLTATDWYGRVWTCNRVQPDVSTTGAGGKLNSVISGTAAHLQTTEERPEADFYLLRMVWFGTFEIPANCATEVVKTVGNQRPCRSWSRDVAIFGSDLGEFVVRVESGRLVLTCEAASPPHKNFLVRVEEALSFVLGRRLFWNYSEEYRDRGRITRIRGQERSDERELPGPVGGVHRDHAGYTWVLFSDLLRFIAGHEGDERPAVARHIFAILQAHQGTIGAYALALGISVEGLCSDLFPPSAAYDDRFRGWVKQLKKHCLAWPAFSTDPEAKVALYDRIGGMIGTLHSGRPKDTLLRLVAAGAVKHELVAAWGKLRNATAHANVKATGTLQDLVTLCDQVLVLFHQLVFKAAGYEGMYTDYSRRGYPPKRYRGRPVTEDEVAVAAYFLWQADDKKDRKDLEHWFKARAMLEKGWV